MVDSADLSDSTSDGNKRRVPRYYKVSYICSCFFMFTYFININGNVMQFNDNI